MAKQDGILKIQGTLDNLTFYKSTDGYVVRTKGGVSRSRILNDPSYARTRENGAEFGGSASSGKLLRNALGTLLFNAKDAKLSSRLMKVMSDVKNLDAVSVRGERNVAVGIQTDAGKLALKGFDFNARAALNSVLYCPFSLNEVTGAIELVNFNAKMQLRAPEGASHFTMQNAVLLIDFETGLSAIEYSNLVSNELQATNLNIVLAPTAFPTGDGVPMYFMLIEFFKRMNGLDYPLNNGAYNVLNLVRVG